MLERSSPRRLFLPPRRRDRIIPQIALVAANHCLYLTQITRLLPRLAVPKAVLKHGPNKEWTVNGPHLLRA